MLRLDLQFYAFFVTVFSGAVLGLLYDVLRVSRGVIRPGRALEGAADLVFWLVATAALAGGLFFANWGELRFYVLVGMTIGVLLYLWLASPIIQWLLMLLFSLVRWVILTAVGIMVRLVVRPLLAVLRLLGGATRLLLVWIALVLTGVWQLFQRVLRFFARCIRRLYRGARLRYLRARRRRRKPPDPT